MSGVRGVLGALLVVRVDVAGDVVVLRRESIISLGIYRGGEDGDSAGNEDEDADSDGDG